MGPYCRFCQHRCFLLRVLKDGRSILLATCPAGMAHDLLACGQTHETAVNPITDPEAARALRVRTCTGCGSELWLSDGTWVVKDDGTSAAGLTYCPPDPDHPNPALAHTPADPALSERT